MIVKSKILIVDDLQEGRDTLESLLLNDAYQLLFAKNGYEMLRLARENQPDLILLDIMMPGLNGFEACERLRKIPAIAETPVIMLTALDDSDSLIRGIEAGADDFISKPFNRIELRARIRGITRLNRYRVLIKERSEKDVIKAQRDEIAKQKKDITDSITYAKNIQAAVFTPIKEIDEIIQENFILFKPKAIVSGDFYYVTQKNGRIIVAVGDCTGHGVPGAFMSLLGLNILNDIMKAFENPESDKILNELDKAIIEALNQVPEQTMTSDGMDISLIVFDTKRRILQYSGANNGINITKTNDEKEDEDPEIITLKPDPYPVGASLMEFKQGFSKQEVEITKKNTIFLYSDGYADQFGGPNDKKFSRKRLRKLFLSLHAYPLKYQRQILENSLEEWKGKAEQIDDILVMGMKL